MFTPDAMSGIFILNLTFVLVYTILEPEIKNNKEKDEAKTLYL